MRAIIRRVNAAGAAVTSGTETISIGRGLCVQVAFHENDTMQDIEDMVYEVLEIKSFSTNKRYYIQTVVEADLEVLCVNQPSFFAVTRGNETTFPNAMPAQDAEVFYAKFLAELRRNHSHWKIKDGGSGVQIEERIGSEGCTTATIDSRPSPNRAIRAGSGERI